MRGPRKTVDAAMFAAPVRVQRPVKGQVWRPDVSDDLARHFLADLGPEHPALFRQVPSIMHILAPQPFVAAAIATRRGTATGAFGIDGAGRGFHAENLEHNGNVDKICGTWVPQVGPALPNVAIRQLKSAENDE